MCRRLFAGVLTAFLLLSSAALGHGGKTDSSGGHRDNKNKSGLGYYHYHCNGYPAHLHDNGVCPYKKPVSKSTTKPMTDEELFIALMEGLPIPDSVTFEIDEESQKRFQELFEGVPIITPTPKPTAKPTPRPTSTPRVKESSKSDLRFETMGAMVVVIVVGSLYLRHKERDE